MSSPLVIQATHGIDHPEKANLPFLIGNDAIAAGRSVTVLLSSDAVWLATHGYASRIEYGGYPSLEVTMSRFIERGGNVAVCRDSARPRSLTTDLFLRGVQVSTGAEIADLCDHCEVLTF